jgi:hypothetical protein
MAGEKETPEVETKEQPEKETPEKETPEVEAKTDDKPKTDDKSADGDGTKKEPWWNARINKLTREKGDISRRAEALQSMVDELQKGGKEVKVDNQPKTDGQRQFTQAELDAEVERRATQKTEVTQFNKDCDAAYKVGKTAHEDFDSALTNFQKLGGLPIDTAQMILETDNPAEVFYALGKDLDKAQEIFDLPPVKRAAALVKFGAKLETPKAKKLSDAPEPIKPPRSGGGAQDADLYNERVPIDVWMRQRNKELAEKNRA